MSERTGTVLIVLFVIFLSLVFMSGGHGGRGSDYYEDQTYQDEYDR